MKKVELTIIALTRSSSARDHYTLILKEQKGLRRMSIIIGEFEAQAIAIAIDQIKLKRPTTHDLFKYTLNATNITIQEVFIHQLVDQVFLAKLIGTKADRTPFEVDARPSDAMALALRLACPIYVTEAILEKVGVMWERPNKVFTSNDRKLEDYSLEELQQLLRQVLAKEDYESASRIRDVMAKLKG